MHPMTVARAVSEQVALVAAPAALAWSWPFSEVAIPAAVLFMAFLGAAIWVFLDQPKGSRLRVYGMAICYALLSAAAAVFIVHVFSFERGIAAPIALLVASGGRPFFLAFRKGGAERIRKTLNGP